MQHYIAYLSKDEQLALGVLLEEYGPLYLPAANWRIGIEGTLRRPPYTLAMWQEWLNYLGKNRGKDEAFAILRKDVDAEGGWRFIGSTGLHNIQWPKGTAVTGSLIIEGESRNKGYGTVAKLLLQKHGFHILGLRKLLSRVKAFNAPSLGHLLKCGYTIYGREEEAELHEGAFVDELHLHVLRRSWEPVWDVYQATGALPRLSDEQRALIKKETKI